MGDQGQIYGMLSESLRHITPNPPNIYISSCLQPSRSKGDFVAIDTNSRQGIAPA